MLKQIVFKLFFIVALTASQIVLANQEKIFTCNVDNQQLSDLFTNHFKFDPEEQIYISPLETSFAGDTFGGTLITLSSEKPTNFNPQLQYTSVEIRGNRGQFWVDCNYIIHNPALVDLMWGHTLKMHSYIPYNYKNCRQDGYSTVRCDVN